MKTLIRCLKCNNNCKMESETKAALISCKQYTSKRSVAAQTNKGKVNVYPVNYNRL